MMMYHFIAGFGALLTKMAIQISRTVTMATGAKFKFSRSSRQNIRGTDLQACILFENELSCKELVCYGEFQEYSEVLIIECTKCTCTYAQYNP